ncbi:MAG: hypothetical protein R3E70_15885 [Burkholderiaceae bacterium]
MQRAGVKYGISSACVGGGQGMACCWRTRRLRRWT